MHVDLECAESFVALGTDLHYGRAAAHLHLSPPALSRRIQRLEHQLGATLLVRGPSGVTALTAAGRRALLDLVDLLAAETDLREATRHPRTVLVLGVPHDGGDGRAFARQALALQRLVQHDDPGARVVVSRVPLPLMTPWLLDARVDVQITAGDVRAPGVRSTPVTTVARVLAVPTASARADAQTLCLADVVEVPLLRDPSLSHEFMAPFWLGDLRPSSQAPLVSIVARDARTVLEHVARGDGSTILIAPQAAAVPDGVTVLRLSDVPRLLLHAATRADDRRPLVRSLVHALTTVLPLADLPRRT